MTRRVLTYVARGLFLAAVLAGAWWSLRDEGDELVDALATATAGGLVLSLALVVGGLVGTGLLWRRIFGLHGARVPGRAAAAIFFTGQLGKYVPGSVWSIGVQARLAHAHDVTPRTTVATSLVFLWVHVATGCLAAGLALPLVPAADDLPGGRWLSAGACLLVGALAMVPAIVHRAARLLAGHDDVVWGLRESGLAAAVMAPVWGAYAAGLWFVLPQGTTPSGALYAALVAAFALGYVAGVAVPVAPAGLGAREAVFVLVLAPTLGVVTAAAVALLARVVHTVADFVVAAGALLLDRARHAA
ncbi:lysylphosphatidylglycerol synthase domain-containing protein [Nocardioides daphniae]|uniref:Uncharacterized protein n=1 Tax=Nocardioides daphniae TaxID=402297 RepID=A0ABQ1Q7X9_9ACTN|nr:lysylphosphatidylglycerol synthase domain-containing protein [Nocardioides daphniae]GGD18311.1 hypothetical protein GCM10007231_16750 [Nocardioides daphniae]